MPDNLYVHFPFCRRKCSYCALYSRAGTSAADRAAYVASLVSQLSSLIPLSSSLSTIYFSGGSPALCDLSVLAPVLRPLCGDDTEFTVELHPLDVTDGKLDELKALGVNRISMGVQSLDDATLAAMGRGYARADAARAFALVKSRFDNAGVDLIVGYPGDPVDLECIRRLGDWGLRHCSVYSLQNERGLKNVPDDDWTLDRLRQVACALREMGLARYEISNYAAPGFACRHNLAVWRGEDYLGLGEGACGRVGLVRTIGRRDGVEESTVDKAEDFKERRLFRLRTREGLDATGCPDWVSRLDAFVAEGLLTKDGLVYRLTDRGTEVCDSILAELV